MKNSLIFVDHLQIWQSRGISRRVEMERKQEITLNTPIVRAGLAMKRQKLCIVLKGEFIVRRTSENNVLRFNVYSNALYFAFYRLKFLADREDLVTRVSDLPDMCSIRIIANLCSKSVSR